MQPFEKSDENTFAAVYSPLKADTQASNDGLFTSRLLAAVNVLLVIHHNLVNPYNVAVSIIVSDVFANNEP